MRTETLSLPLRRPATEATLPQACAVGHKLREDSPCPFSLWSPVSYHIARAEDDRSGADMTAAAAAGAIEAISAAFERHLGTDDGGSGGGGASSSFSNGTLVSLEDTLVPQIARGP